MEFSVVAKAVKQLEDFLVSGVVTFSADEFNENCPAAAQVMHDAVMQHCWGEDCTGYLKQDDGKGHDYAYARAQLLVMLTMLRQALITNDEEHVLALVYTLSIDCFEEV